LLFEPDNEDSVFLQNAGKITTFYGITSQKIAPFSPSIIYREEKEVLDVQEIKRIRCHEEKKDVGVLTMDHVKNPLQSRCVVVM
jgi:hypothetical protein